MSEKRDPNGCFDAMSTQQLEDLLRLDAEGAENLDTDSLFYIMELLAARQPGRSAEEAFQELRNEYLHQPEKKQGGFSRLLLALEATAAVAAVIFFGILISNALGLRLWGTPPRQPEGEGPRSVASVAIPDAEGREVAVGTVTIDRYSISASIEEEDTQERSYEISVCYSFYLDNAALPDEYWTVVGDPITTTGGSIILEESRGSGYSSLRSAEVTFRELSSGESVTQSVMYIRPIFE